MGRIRTKALKRAAKQILKNSPERFAAEFTENKEILTRIAKYESKKIRNIVAGYITHIKKQEK
ncbi:30S ribosomal protein S17e [archaeon]|nr:30S ribosomal protein S17e [archaeon]